MESTHISDAQAILDELMNVHQHIPATIRTRFESGWTRA